MAVSRRSFTLGLGASLLFGGVLGGPLRSKEARADAPGKAARRVVFFFSPNGTVHKHWRPTGSEEAFAFPKGGILEPLEAQKKDLVILDGINFDGFDNHEPGMRGMLTGQPGGGIFAGKSVDQYLAGKIGGASRYASVELGALTSIWGSNPQTRMSYGGPSSVVDPEDDPGQAFGRLFGEAIAQANDPGAAARMAARRKSILDAVRGDIADLNVRLSASQRVKLEQHAESIRSMEKSFQGGLSCATPEAPSAVDAHSMASFPAVAKAQTDLMVLALGCGLTKVASLQLSHTVSPLLMSWLDLGEAHHELSHKDDSNTQGVQNFVKAERWFAEQFGYLLTQLQAMPDPEGGGSLLDTSLVVWAKELGDSRMHDAKSVPFVLAGKANGALRTGRYLDFKGVSHHQFLASICQAAGVDPTELGASGKVLPGLLG